jgi:hypothetical protein
MGNGGGAETGEQPTERLRGTIDHQPASYGHMPEREEPDKQPGHDRKGCGE